MKRITTLLLILLSFNFIQAQITITNSDMPSSGDTIRFSQTSDIKNNDPTLTGANYNWNYSTLVPDSQRIDTFYSVGSTPIPYQFYFNNGFSYPNHKASYALKGPDISFPQVVDITEVFNYYKNSSSAYENVGFGSKINGTPSSTQNNPVDREYAFPMNYLNTDSSYSAFTVSVPSFGAYGKKMARIDTVDGWGTLILPSGTYNVLRVKSKLLQVDSVYFASSTITIETPRPEEIEYKWLANGKGLPVLKITTVAGNVTQIEYQDSLRLNVSIAELQAIKSLNMYPNPVKSKVYINFNSTYSGSGTITLNDMLGREINIISNENIIVGDNQLILDLSQYSIKPGLYFIGLTLDNKIMAKEKIIITE